MYTPEQLAKLKPEEIQAEMQRVKALIDKGHTTEPNTQQGILPQAGNMLKNFVVGAGRAGLGLDPTKEATTGETLADKMMLEKYKAGLKPNNPKLIKSGTSVLQQNPDTGEMETLFEGTDPEKMKMSQELFEMKKEKAERERIDAQKKEEAAQVQKEDYSQMVKDSANDTLNTIKEIEGGIKHFGTFGGFPSMPGTSRVKWEANIDKLLSGKVIDLMTKMKEASKTGATGFGQLSEKELAVLQNASTALKRTLSPEDAQSILNELKTKLNRISETGRKINAPDGEPQEDIETRYQRFIQTTKGQ